MDFVKLTEYSHGAGCGCKIAPGVLEEILSTSRESAFHEHLLVGNRENDDAAAFDLGNGTSVLSTTDFFMPIVDDPYTFGQIAATNAISDVYAMGGRPLMAISILGWPIDKLSAEVAQKVIEGGAATCKDAGIPLAGGHSIDSPEPIFGLAVTGLVDNVNLKTNSGATDDCLLYLTKPLGIGILTTAQKRKKIEQGHIQPAVDAMCTLNKIGAKVAPLKSVKAITDVTGFGLMGHLTEMCDGSSVSAVIEDEQVPFLPQVHKYLELNCIPGGTKNNFKSYGHKLGPLTPTQEILLCDAQTSGGLLIAVERSGREEFERTLREAGMELSPIGYTTPRGEHSVTVK